MLEHNVEGLLVLASQSYFEDSGTPRSDDDYGYEGLRQVLSSKLKLVKSLRYEIEYRNINVRGNQAEVEIREGPERQISGCLGNRQRPPARLDGAGMLAVVPELGGHIAGDPPEAALIVELPRQCWDQQGSSLLHCAFLLIVSAPSFRTAPAADATIGLHMDERNST